MAEKNEQLTTYIVDIINFDKIGANYVVFDKTNHSGGMFGPF